MALPRYSKCRASLAYTRALVSLSRVTLASISRLAIPIPGRHAGPCACTSAIASPNAHHPRGTLPRQLRLAHIPSPRRAHITKLTIPMPVPLHARDASNCRPQPQCSRAGSLAQRRPMPCQRRRRCPARTKAIHGTRPTTSGGASKDALSYASMVHKEPGGGRREEGVDRRSNRASDTQHARVQTNHTKNTVYLVTHFFPGPPAIS